MNENTEEKVTVEEEVEEEAVEKEQEAEESQEESSAPEPKKRAESQIDRLKRERDEAKAKLAKFEEGGNTNAGTDDALLARLENRGVMDQEDQAYVIRFAKSEGISPIEALNDEIVKDKLAYFKKQRETKASTFTGTNRTGGKVDEVERAVARYKKDGTLPDNNPALVSKILSRLI